ncbi:hypothetical protein JAAARDRAFT_60784 [Jaapia argillacea MUCL 33604]|uniref:Uncharacterized protein n=1 Tax=Jaapia argillacea MUCL 33604 TaxID=933084 RepID=A0A067PSX0_9AGAM|nr:hypothetical protein JAAARDRAFT_60784 [Jaapia argillacea MUCL 33604]
MPITLASPLSLYSILGVWLTGFYPIVRRTILLKSLTGFNNVQPRANVNRLREKYPDIAARAERMEGANAVSHTAANFEQYRVPRYLHHLKRKRDSTPMGGSHPCHQLCRSAQRNLNLFSLAFIAMRMLYNYIYMSQTTQAQGDLRTVVWTVGTIIPAILIVKSGNAALAAAV